MTPNVAEQVRSTSPQESTVLLEVKHLNVHYETGETPVHAVNDVSFTLHRGQILGLAGESEREFASKIADQQDTRLPWVRRKAVGKSEEAPSIDILNLSPAQLRAFRWQELAIVFQSAMNALNPVMRLETQITDVLKAHNTTMSAEERHQRAVELLRLVGIAPDRLRSYPHELSGGMRQRAIIAIALALQPEIIIMDEPTTALDVVVQRDILVELMALREHLNFAVIFITHDLSLLLEISDQVAIMYAGKMVEMAPWREIYRSPHHPYTYGLLNSFPSLHGPRRKMSGIPGSPPDLRNVPSGCAFHPRCAFAFDACSKYVPVLATPQVKGVHIEADGLEMDQPLSSTNASTRFQQCQVACHLYNKEEGLQHE